MFDFIYQAQAHQDRCQERLQQALAKAERERIWERPPRPTLYRRTLARLGAALVATGTWLQGDKSPKPATRFDPIRNTEF